MGSSEHHARWLWAVLSVPALAGVVPVTLAQDMSAPQAMLVQTENIRLDYGQVLRAEPIYETQMETWLEQQCQDGKRKFLSRIVGAVKDVFAQPQAESGQTSCRQVPVEREFRRLVGYDVDYMYKGSKYRSRMPDDPGNKIKLRVSVAPYATLQPN